MRDCHSSGPGLSSSHQRPPLSLLAGALTPAPTCALGRQGNGVRPASVGGRLQRCARPTLQVDAKSEESEGPAPSLAGTHGQPPPAPSAQRPAPLRPEAPPPFSHSAAGLGAHPTWWTCCSFWDCWPGLGGGRPPEAGAGEPADDGDAFSRPRRTERSLRPETGHGGTAGRPEGLQRPVPKAATWQGCSRGSGQASGKPGRWEAPGPGWESGCYHCLTPPSCSASRGKSRR